MVSIIYEIIGACGFRTSVFLPIEDYFYRLPSSLPIDCFEPTRLMRSFAAAAAAAAPFAVIEVSCKALLGSGTSRNIDVPTQGSISLLYHVVCPAGPPLGYFLEVRLL